MLCRDGFDPDLVNQFAVRILDRPYGKGSRLRVVTPNMRMRASGRGKPAILEVTAHPNSDPFDWDPLIIELHSVDRGKSYRPDSARDAGGHWCLDQTRRVPAPTAKRLYKRIKIYITRTTLFFKVSVQTRNGGTISGESVHFFTTNSGNQIPGPSTNEETKVDSHSPQTDDFVVSVNLSVDGNFLARGCILFILPDVSRIQFPLDRIPLTVSFSLCLSDPLIQILAFQTRG
jgi:hypothetical protein